MCNACPIVTVSCIFIHTVLQHTDAGEEKKVKQRQMFKLVCVISISVLVGSIMSGEFLDRAPRHEP